MKIADEYDITKGTGVHNEYIRIRIKGKILAIDELGIVIGLGRSRDMNGNVETGGGRWEITEPVSGLMIVGGHTSTEAVEKLHELTDHQIEYIQRIQTTGDCEEMVERKCVRYIKAPELREEGG